MYSQTFPPFFSPSPVEKISFHFSPPHRGQRSAATERAGRIKCFARGHLSRVYTCHVWAEPGCFQDEFPTYYVLLSPSIYWAWKEHAIMAFLGILRTAFEVTVKQICIAHITKVQTGKMECEPCIQIYTALTPLSPSLKTGPDLFVAWTDHPLRLRAAGAEATDGFPAGEPG